jgi:hypothetical protein
MCRVRVEGVAERISGYFRLELAGSNRGLGDLIREFAA